MEWAFWGFMLVMALLVPGTMIGCGSYFEKGGPKKINGTFGYRTERSMRNQESWAFAHRYCGRLWRRMGWPALAGSAAAMLAVAGRSVDCVAWFAVGLIVAQGVLLTFSIWLTERALKGRFGR